jgi:hypothetical protein
MAKSIYIAGPMSGYPNWNYDSFFKAHEKLEKEGWKVYNPAAKDQEMGYGDDEARATGNTALSIKKGTFDFREAYLWDLTKIIEGHGIYMLRGWEQSPGARGEHAAAVAMNKHYPDFQIIYE